MGFVTNSQLKNVQQTLVDNLKNGKLIPSQAIAAKSISPVSEESGTIQDAPFISQGTGTNNNVDSVDTSPVARQLEKQGNTVPVIQLIKSSWLPSTQTVNGITLTNNGDGSLTLNGTATDLAVFGFGIGHSITVGHKYMILGGDGSSYGFNSYDPDMWNKSSGQTAPKCLTAYTSGQPASGWRIVVINGATVNNAKIIPCLFDITSWKDSIITDLTANPSHFSWYYNDSLAYNAGSLQNANGRYLVCTHRNLWDEVWEQGSINSDTGANQSSTTRIRSKNYILVIPNTTVYAYVPYALNVYFYDANKNYMQVQSGVMGANLVIPANCRFIRFSIGGSAYPLTTYGNNITLSQYYTPAQGGEGYNQYYPYVAPNEYDTGNESLKAFDNKLPSGVIERNTGEYTFTGSEEWTWYEWGGVGFWYYQVLATQNDTQNVICSNGIKAIMQGSEGNLRVYPSDNPQITSSTNMNTVFGNGTKVQYKLAIPTTEQGTTFPEVIEVDDYGIMYWLDNDRNLVGVPQGCKVFYPVDYVLYLDTLNSRTNGDANNIALTDEITDTALNARGYYKMQDLLTTFGANGMVGGTLRQMFAKDKSLEFLNTGCVDLGTLTWTLNSSGVFSATLTGAKPTTETDTDSMFLSTKYKTVISGTSGAHAGEDKVIFKGASSGGICYVDIRDTAYSDATTFANAMKGVLVAYEKA